MSLFDEQSALALASEKNLAPVSLSVRCSHPQKLLTKQRTGQKTRKTEHMCSAEHRVAGFWQFFFVKRLLQFLERCPCPRVSRAQRTEPATCVAGVHPLDSRQSHIYLAYVHLPCATTHLKPELKKQYIGPSIYILRNAQTLSTQG